MLCFTPKEQSARGLLITQFWGGRSEARRPLRPPDSTVMTCRRWVPRSQTRLPGWENSPSGGRPVPPGHPAALLPARRTRKGSRFGSVCRTANRRHRPGIPLSSRVPRSSKPIPDPATTSLTVLETRTSPEPASAATRAPVWTAMPLTFPSTSSHSPVCRPGPDLDPEVARRTRNRAAGLNRPGRRIERDQEPVARQCRSHGRGTERAVLGPPRDGPRAGPIGGPPAPPPTRSTRRCR